MVTDIIIGSNIYRGVDPALAEQIRQMYEAATVLKRDFELLVDKVKEVRLKETTAKEKPKKSTRIQAYYARQELYQMVYANYQK